MGSSADAGLVEVSIHSGAGDAEHVGDLLDGVLAGVVQVLGEFGLMRGQAWSAATMARARAAASPSRVLATISSR